MTPPHRHVPREGLRHAIFPTARRLLVERSLRRVNWKGRRRILAVGASCDPYRTLFDDDVSYVTLDIIRVKDAIDILADAQRLPFADGNFDCVVALELLEHLPHPHRFLSEAHRVLAPGGLLAISAPFLFHYHADPKDYWRPTPDAFALLLDAFSSYRLIRHGHRVHVLSDLVTTAFSPYPWFAPLRVFNHLLAYLPGSLSEGTGGGTATTGHLVAAVK